MNESADNNNTEDFPIDLSSNTRIMNNSEGTFIEMSNGNQSMFLYCNFFFDFTDDFFHRNFALNSSESGTALNSSKRFPTFSESGRFQCFSLLP